MKMPSNEAYTDAMQAPVATIVDPVLSKGRVQTNSWGAPLGRTGTFALTFQIAARGSKYAFRCFQQDRPGMRERYNEISQFLSQHPLPYFVDFTYQEQGIRVAGQIYPTIRMDWAEGSALGNYIEENLNDSGRLRALQQQLHGMALALAGAGIAHGDIQSNNIIVGAAGDIRLVDYDGMYVPSLASKGSIETGHRNFQHAGRAIAAPFDATLDRFSFALIHTALSALIESPGVWKDLQADNDTLLLRASDLSDPLNSAAFDRLKTLPLAGPVAARLQAIAAAPYSDVPTFADFLVGRNIPELPANTPKAKKAPTGASSAGGGTAWYLAETGTGGSSASRESGPAATSSGLKPHEPGWPVLAGSDPSMCMAHCDRRVEIVGLVSKVQASPQGGLTVYFDSNSLSAPVRARVQRSTQVPTIVEGQWLAVTGEPTRELDSSGAFAPCMPVSNPANIERLSAQQARWRLSSQTSGAAKAGSGAGSGTATASNDQFIAGLSGSGSSPGKPAGPTLTPNPNSPLIGASGAAPGPSGKRDWSLPIVFAIIIGIVAILVTMAIASNGSTSSTGYVGPVDATPTDAYAAVDNASSASEFFAKCFSSLNPVTEVTCGSSDAQFRAGSVTVVDAVTCEGLVPGSQPFQAGDGQYVCMDPVGSANAATNADLYETCVTSDNPNASLQCFDGMGWSYDTCWDAGGQVLQQFVGGRWKTVNSDIVRSEGCDDTQYPYWVQFDRKASSVGTKKYRIVIGSDVVESLTISVAVK